MAPPLVRLSLALGRTALAQEVADHVERAVSLAPREASVNSAALRCRGLVQGDPDLMLRAVELAATSRRALDSAGACED